MSEVKEYIEQNRTMLAIVLLCSICLGVLIYVFMWFLSKDGMEDRMKLEEKNKLGYIITTEYSKEGIMDDKGTVSRFI